MPQEDSLDLKGAPPTPTEESSMPQLSKKAVEIMDDGEF
jgi:hypothetical protein